LSEHRLLDHCLLKTYVNKVNDDLVEARHLRRHEPGLLSLLFAVSAPVPVHLKHDEVNFIVSHKRQHGQGLKWQKELLLDLLHEFFFLVDFVNYDFLFVL
jgi:hypothetical protein